MGKWDVIYVSAFCVFASTFTASFVGRGRMDKKCHSAKLGALGSKFIESVPHNCDREWKFAYC